jgi:lipopolysaccharide cholinephosphotransferase
MKIGRKGTLYCLRDAQNLKIASEITVDIFPVDYIKEKNLVRKELDGKLRRFLRVCSLNWDEKKLLMISIKKSAHSFKSFYIVGLFILHFVRLLLGEDRINRIIYRMYVDTTGNSGRMGCAMIDSYTYPADYKITKMVFEERMLPVMDTYDEILTKQYGNYMEYPPEEKRYNSKMAEWVLQVEEL